MNSLNLQYYFIKITSDQSSNYEIFNWSFDLSIFIIANVTANDTNEIEIADEIEITQNMVYYPYRAMFARSNTPQQIVLKDDFISYNAATINIDYEQEIFFQTDFELYNVAFIDYDLTISFSNEDMQIDVKKYNAAIFDADYVLLPSMQIDSKRYRAAKYAVRFDVDLDTHTTRMYAGIFIYTELDVETLFFISCIAHSYCMSDMSFSMYGLRVLPVDMDRYESLQFDYDAYLQIENMQFSLNQYWLQSFVVNDEITNNILFDVAFMFRAAISFEYVLDMIESINVLIRISRYTTLQDYNNAQSVLFNLEELTFDDLSYIII